MRTGLGYLSVVHELPHRPGSTLVLIRLVRMTFRPDRVEDFRTLFSRAAPRIRAFDGCLHLELWRDARYSNILTTYSHWTGQEALDRYRKSALFKETWADTTPLFAAPPLAYSHFRVLSEEMNTGAA